MISVRADTRDSLWQPQPTCFDARLRRWLLDRGSLTQRIQSRCDSFRVALLSQRLAAIGHDERGIIAVRRGQRCLVREVSLYCGATPVVFAHSVVEPHALHGPWRMLATLGNRPLGAALFADPRVQRFPLRFRRLGRSHALYHRACELLARPPLCLWGRRSLFVLRRSRLLVTEVFLPAILALTP